MDADRASEEFKFMTDKFVSKQSIKLEKKKSVMTSGNKASKDDP